MTSLFSFKSSLEIILRQSLISLSPSFSPSQASSALHGAPPGGELPGYRRCASPLLLRAAVHLRHQQAGAGEAGRVQLSGGPG